MRRSNLLVMVLASLSLAAASGQAHAADWSVANVDELNSPYHDTFSTVSGDGLTMYFGSDRPGGYGIPIQGLLWMVAPMDIYVTHRATRSSPWGPPVNLGARINTSGNDHSVTVTPDGHHMIFSSDRAGGCGGTDLWVSYRDDVGSDLAWQAPRHIPCAGQPGGVNGAFEDGCANLFVDPDTGSVELYFASFATPDPTSMDIKVASVDLATLSFGPPQPVQGGINTAHNEGHLDPMHGYMWVIYPDPGSLLTLPVLSALLNDSDIYISQRTETGWSRGVNAGPQINTPHEEQLPAPTADGKSLFFPSNRPGGHGNLDIYEARQL